MSPDLLPALDAAPLPGPIWLFHLLLGLTFFLHVAFMNLALGGTILAAVSQLLARGRADDPRTHLAGRLMGVNTYAISFAITTGVAPLLFIQLLYQQYFYSATLLVPWAWLGFVGLLMVGYYSAYLYKFRGTPATGRGGTVWLVLAAALFLGVAMVHVAVNLLHAQPGRWASLADGSWTVLADPTYWPRLLHFVLAAIAWSALIAAWWAARRARAGHDVAMETAIARYAWAWALGATVAQALDGFVFLFLLPREVLLGLFDGGLATLLPLLGAIVLALGLLAMLARVRNPVAHPGTVQGTLVAMTLAIVLMVVTRHQLRQTYLEPFRTLFPLEVAPQWTVFGLFAVLLVAGLCLVAVMVRSVFRSVQEA